MTTEAANQQSEVSDEQSKSSSETSNPEANNPAAADDVPIPGEETTTTDVVRAPTDTETEASNNTNQLPPTEFMVKHPLMYTWVLWYCKSEKGKNWEDCLKQVAEFDTVEDFWALYNHIQLASGLPYSSDYYLFKKGIMPMWEDKQNKEGGRWLIQIDRQQRSEILDVYWLELLMAMVGEQFDDGSDNVCGAVVNVRNKGDKISLWTRDGHNEDCNRKIGQILKQKLNLQGFIAYEMHSDTSQKTGSMVRAQLRV